MEHKLVFLLLEQFAHWHKLVVFHRKVVHYSVYFVGFRILSISSPEVDIRTFKTGLKAGHLIDCLCFPVFVIDLHYAGTGGKTALLD